MAERSTSRRRKANSQSLRLSCRGTGSCKKKSRDVAPSGPMHQSQTASAHHHSAQAFLFAASFCRSGALTAGIATRPKALLRSKVSRRMVIREGVRAEYALIDKPPKFEVPACFVSER